MAQKASLPKGTRDFLPQDVLKRNYLFETLKHIFKQHGFSPIETPSFELSSTLMGKYGEEGDRLIFRILNSGDKMKKADLEALAAENLPRFANSLSEKALRYDLTVPFARFVVQHQNDISFPFKRYQIQPVWRADRPQKGRYQEFYQCDVDVVGSDSLLYEVDYVQIIDEALSTLKIPSFNILINNRKILSGIAEVTGQTEHLIDITVAIDKLDKIGKDGVIAELKTKGIPDEAIAKITPLFDFATSLENEQAVAEMKSYLASSETGKKGVEELEFVLEKTKELGLRNGILKFDVTLARGLNYYTGAIFEVKVNGVEMGSIVGGGRYDDLTGLFGLKGVSGVGISFGAARIFDVLNELNLFPADLSKGIKLLFLNFGEKEAFHSLKLMQKLRKNAIDCDLYPEESKIQKQLKYANNIHAQFVAMVGEAEMQKDVILLKNMESGEQTELKLDELLLQLK